MTRAHAHWRRGALRRDDVSADVWDGVGTFESAINVVRAYDDERDREAREKENELRRRQHNPLAQRAFPPR